MKAKLRRIQEADDVQIAKLIRQVMSEFSCVGDGYSINDPEVDEIFERYSQPRHAFWVVEENGEILGCGGIGQLTDAEDTFCELKKMYFYPQLRGQGWGRKIVETCLRTAQQFGYQQCYIETVDRMENAIALYRKIGFAEIPNQLGNTGHFGCDRYFLIDIGNARFS